MSTKQPARRKSPATEKAKKRTKRSEPSLTMSVPEAGKHYFGLSKNGSYAAAERGDIPTVKVGKLLRVPVRLMERKLDEAAA
jgi:hypothetical protein